MGRTPERFLQLISLLETSDPKLCILWLGGTTGKSGYGRLWFEGKPWLAHVLACEQVHGPVPKSLQLDHKCRVRLCINPEHLEPVTGSENVGRGRVPEVMRARAVAITHCPQGHPYSDSNGYRDPKGSRRCKVCRRESMRRGVSYASLS